MNLFFHLLIPAVVVSTSVATTTNANIQVDNTPCNIPFTVHFNPGSTPQYTRTSSQFIVSEYNTNGFNDLHYDLNAVGDDDILITNQVVRYTATVGVGVGGPDKTPTNYNLWVDTGSANTWIGAQAAYVPSSTSYKTGDIFSRTYRDSSIQISGDEYLDQITLNSDLVITNQSIAAVTPATAKGFSGADGILGLGPVDLTLGSLTGKPTVEVPTVLDNLANEDSIPEHLLGIYFEPTVSGVETGEISFGAIDSTKHTGQIHYAPITRVAPSKTYWGLDLSISYGSLRQPVLKPTAGIVDTSSTFIQLSADAFALYATLTGGTFDSKVKLLKVTEAQKGALQTLYFDIKGITLEFTANAQLFPKKFNALIGGDPAAQYLVASPLATQTGAGLDFVLGFAFVQRYYTILDGSNHRIGFATTKHTLGMTN